MIFQKDTDRQGLRLLLFMDATLKDLFLERMEKRVKEEYDAYVDTLSFPAYRGIRKNLLKDSGSLLEETFALEPSNFCKEGYYMKEDISGNHPYHLQGLFYMQEPSASSAVSILDVKEHDWVLDLCAAPGGKSSQIASMLNHTGLLVSNEIIKQRAQILLSNLERMGVSENLIVNTSCDILCKEMKGCFDKVLVDAPCSGEGMFKKHENAGTDWSVEHVKACATRQLSILKEAYHALKKDGILVYSTCTYSMEENEQVVYAFLKEHPDMELIDCGVSFGRSGIAYQDLDVSKVRRIFPMDQGEGHFIAKMKRNSENEVAKLSYGKEKQMPQCVSAFLNEQLKQVPQYYYEKDGKVFIKHTPFIQLKKSHVLRQGIMCGEMIKQRFEPHHHFYMASKLDVDRKHVVSLNEEECRVYLSGNVIQKDGDKGYVGLSYQGHMLGFGKCDGHMIKNIYLK